MGTGKARTPHRGTSPPLHGTRMPLRRTTLPLERPRLGTLDVGYGACGDRGRVHLHSRSPFVVNALVSVSGGASAVRGRAPRPLAL
jgi:hypothetical protein